MGHFYSLFKEGESVLDVGVSPESKKALPARNYFLKNYRYNHGTYTGLGVRDLTGMENLFPGKRFVQYPGGKFPFSDKEFDWVFSNAVIEHVGDDCAQLLFLNEMMRVANNVFFTTPNKYFPIESHTNVFFLHWNDKLYGFSAGDVSIIAKKTNGNLTLVLPLDLSMSREEAEEALTQLEKDGIVYRSSNGTIKRADIEF